jgi:uncharacterized protein (TIGR02217 family)
VTGWDLCQEQRDMANFPFLEERLSANVRAGVKYGDDYNVEVTKSANGARYHRLVHPYPERRFQVFYTQLRGDLWDQALSLYHRVYGKYAGFRVKAIDDYSTNARTGTPTAFDQSLALVSTGIYQLQVAYGGTGAVLDIGKPVRTIFKPVSGTVKVGIGSLEVPITTMWTVDTTTGKITFAANKTASITSITQAASAVLTVGAHSFAVGESVHISGVSGMTQINSQRGQITSIGATTITVAINSSAFSAYASGGTVNTRPQAGESVLGGCEFDIPCVFDTSIDISTLSPEARETEVIELVELLNP